MTEKYINETIFNESYIGLRYDLIKHIKGSDLTIMDVGCATGSNGKYLLENNIGKAVHGIEYDYNMATIARQSYTDVQIGDIEKMDLLTIYKGIQFDYILIGDILEHLKNPWNILLLLKECLKSDGKIIFSVPNFQHIDVFIHVFIKGIYPYNERGIFDKTHLRFFTWKNIEELVERSFLEIIKVDRNYRYRDNLKSKFPFYGKLLKHLFKNYYTFQYIVVCKKIMK
jgi:2-polyprenyl-3-methyl-5-hydroxy-6-metoxy-1,4-benzoquinol methylase